MIRLPSPSASPGLKLLSLTAILALAAVTPGQNSPRIGFPDDWSHRHVIFSNPGTAAQAIQNGTYSRWARIVTDPRFMLQHKKREAAASVRINMPLAPPEMESEAEPAESESPEEVLRPSENSSRRGVSPAVGADGEPLQPLRHRLRHRHHKHTHSNLHLDWSETLLPGATLGLGVYPAKFSFNLNSASCASPGPPDFVVYSTSLSGDASHASLVAFDNLYVPGCGVAPSVYWAYNTGGAIVTSVVLSLDGSQVAFVQSSASAASLVVLRWTPGAGTPGAPTPPNNVAANMLRTCTLPCMTVIPFSGGADDTGSSVYPDYGTDTIYVGDNTGKLHKFTGVFAGMPAEAGAPWPVKVNTAGEGLSSPAFDPISGNILVGDYLISSMPNCAMSTCGFLYAVKASNGAVTQSARLDYVFGLVDGPLLDLAASTAYVFVGADSNFQNAGSPCGVRQACSGVVQIPISFASNAAGTEAETGIGFQFMLIGTPDNAFFTSATPAKPTGNLYVVGNTGNGDNTLYQIPIASNVMGAPNVGPAISENFSVGSLTAAGMGLIEIFSNAHDYIFTSVLTWPEPTTSCTVDATDGCVMGFDVTSGVINAMTTPTGTSNVAHGASAIIIDNTVTALGGASNIYYTPLADQTCILPMMTMAGCAIQISQSSP